MPSACSDNRPQFSADLERVSPGSSTGVVVHRQFGVRIGDRHVIYPLCSAAVRDKSSTSTIGSSNSDRVPSPKRAPPLLASPPAERWEEESLALVSPVDT
jgi:hypothetical protein